MIVNILYPSEELKEIKISSGMWTLLHRDTKWKHPRDKRYIESYQDTIRNNKPFLDKYNLPYTTFNLNSLRELKGVVLTKQQIKKIKI